MAEPKTVKQYEAELRRMIKARTGADCEVWLKPQIRATAMNMVMLDKIQDELTDMDSLITPVPGSMGQLKNEVSPLLPHYDKLQRTLLMQFEALGLNYSTTGGHKARCGHGEGRADQVARGGTGFDERGAGYGRLNELNELHELNEL